MTKIRTKNGRYRGLDLSDQERLQLLDELPIQPHALPTRKCKRKECGVEFTPRFSWHMYHCRKCSDIAAHAAMRQRHRKIMQQLRRLTSGKGSGRGLGKAARLAETRLNVERKRKQGRSPPNANVNGNAPTNG